MRFNSVALVLLLICSPLFGQNRSTVREIVDLVNRDSLQSYVERLQAFGTRYEYTPQRDSAAQYVASTFSRWGLTTLSDRYSIGTIFWDAALLTKDSLWIVGENGLLLFSSDGGQTWVEQPTAINQTLYGIDMQSDGVGIAVGAMGTIVRTTDAGAHWSSVATPTGAYLISVSFGSSTTAVTVGTGGTILRTTTGGVSWDSIPSGTTQDLFDVQFISPSKAIAIGSSGYILRSTNAGKNWEKQSSGTNANLFSLSFIDSLNGFVSGIGPTLLKTINGGSAWTPLSFSSTQSSGLYGVFFADSMHGCVVGDTRIFSTEDGGQVWQVADSLDRSATRSSLNKLRGVAGQRMLLLGSSSLVVTSSDNGVTWTDYSNTLPSSVFHESRNIVATIPGGTRQAIECVLVAHYDSYSDNPFVSAPGANDNATGTAAVMEAARICSGYRFASTLKLVAVSGEELGLLGSQHYVEAARNENRNIKGVVNADMLGCPFSGDTLNFGVESFYNRNRLVDSCIAYNQRYGIGLHIITGVDSVGESDHASFARYGYDAVMLSESGEYKYVHTQNDLATALNFGLVRRAAQLIIAAGAELADVIGRATEVERASNSQPKQFVLHQNYPNPFNPTTEIHFSIAKLSIVNLRIFDLLGREVATLVNEQRPVGDYSVKWEAGNLPSGVYFCRLQAGSYSETRKLVLLR
jgi:photosystem II stability/assembly factor-like uncharacterized protein